MVFCAGNNWGGPYVWAPGNYPITIGVGATDYADIKDSFSCVGHAPDANPWNIRDYWSRQDWDTMGVDLMAPGTKDEAQGIGIYSADKDDPHGYIHMWGTSQATPHVTGAIALMLEASQDYFGYKIDYYDIYNILIDAANRDAGGPFPNVSYGWGRLDCKSAVDSVLTFHLKSSSPTALANNNQKKIAYDPNQQKIHLVYQSGQYIRYTYTTDFGTAWSLEEKVGDGEAPCLALDAEGNPHCVFKDGKTIRYCRRINGHWQGPYVLFDDWFTYDVLHPSFDIWQDTGYVAFEGYGLGFTKLVYGTFIITESNPGLTWIVLDQGGMALFRFRPPCLTIQPINGTNTVDIHIVYGKFYEQGTPGNWESYFCSRSNNWVIIPIAIPNDEISSDNPFVIATSDRVWVFWEEGRHQSDIYYRIWTSGGWQNEPTPIYRSLSFSVFPRAVKNAMNSEVVYVVWAEFNDENNQWDVFCTEYYDGWLPPINISNTNEVDSKNPDIVYIPSLMEGKLLISFAEGNAHWTERGKYLSLYQIKTSEVFMPLSGGGPQDKHTMPTGSPKPELAVNPNPFKGKVEIRYMMQDTGCRILDVGQGFSLVPYGKRGLSQSGAKSKPEGLPYICIYDVSGRIVKSFNLESCIGNQVSAVIWDGTDDFCRKLPSGVYFVRLETEGYTKTEKVILLK